jgi:NADPH:quinone reductase-like Zn-dependent oxidoreductase
MVRNGGYAELVSIPEVNAIPIPADFSFDEAAAVPLVFLTAWHMLVARAELRAGEEVLVLGAGSGVGSAAIQIARLLGARVIATAGSDDKLAKARELGADQLINHSTQDIHQEVKRLTNKRGVDVVFEHVGEATWEKSMMSLAPGGRLITCGATTGPDVRIDLRYLFGRQLSVLGSFMGSKAELLEVLKFIFQRRLRPVIDTAFPLAEARAAHQRMERREQFGKIILHP